MESMNIELIPKKYDLHTMAQEENVDNLPMNQGYTCEHQPDNYASHQDHKVWHPLKKWNLPCDQMGLPKLKKSVLITICGRWRDQVIGQP